MYNYDVNQGNFKKLQQYYQNQSKRELYLKRFNLILIFSLVVASAYLFDQRPEALTANQTLLSLGIIWVSLIPTIQYLSDHQRPPIPFLPLVGLFYATSFGIPMFSAGKKVHYVWSLENVSEEALWLTLLGVLAINIAFYACKYSIFSRISALKLYQSYSINRLIILLWVLLISHILFLYLPFIQEIPSINQFLDPVGFVSYGMFYILNNRGRFPLIQKLILLGIFLPLEIISRFSSGALAQVMILGLYIVLIIIHESKRIPVFLIAAILMFFLVLNPIKGQFRMLTWGNQSQQLSPIEKSQLFIDLAIKTYSSEFKEKTNSEENATLARTAHILLFSEVVKDTPNRVPYWNGQTYLPLLTSFIPRIILPDKLSETTGNQFGRRYNYLVSDDYGTSFNLPWIVEMYANFGQLGVIIGMLLVGTLFAFLERKFNQSNMGALESVIGTTIIFRLIYQESNFSLMTGGVITLTVSLYLLFKFFLFGKR